MRKVVQGRHQGSDQIGRIGRQRRRLPLAAVTGSVALLVACGGSVETTVSVPTTDARPTSLDGVWLLEGSNLLLDITLATATVDGRTDCGRTIGSLTFADDGDPTSFSLPGRDDSRCSRSEAAALDAAVELLESVNRAEPHVSGYRLYDGENDRVGLLRPGG